MKLKLNIIIFSILMISGIGNVFANDILEKVLTTEEINKIVRNENNEYGSSNKYWNNETGEFIIPDSYTKISEAAFPSKNYFYDLNMGVETEKCLIKDRVKKIVIPNTVIDIGCGAFAGLMDLKTIVLPNNVGEIGKEAFSETDIREVKWPKSLTKIENHMFAYGNLEKIEIPDSVTHIGNGVFLSTRLEKINIPDSVKSIGSNVFCECSSLKEVRLPNKLEKISEGMFGSTILENVNIPESIVEIGNGAFTGCKLKEMVLPRGLTKIGDRGFWCCEELERLEMEGVKSLGDYVFSNCNKLKELVVSKEFFTSGGISKKAFEANPDEFYSEKGEAVKDNSIDVYVEDGIEGLNIEEIKKENRWLRNIELVLKEEGGKVEKKEIPNTGMDKKDNIMLCIVVSIEMVMLGKEKSKKVM